MTESILWAKLTDPGTVAAALAWPEPAYMYLERGLGAWLTDDQIADGVRLEALDLRTDFAAWAKGRIFCADFELRWEQVEQHYAAILIGAAPPLAGFVEAEELDLSRADVSDRHCILWGLRINDSDLAAAGVERAGRGEPYLELRIPRVLRYPVPGATRRTALKVREYLDASTGAVLHYRMLGVEER